MTVKRIMNKYGYFPPTVGRKLEVCRIYKFFAGNAAANGSNARIYMVHECQRRTLSQPLAQWLFPK